jgi:hypothetical protein
MIVILISGKIGAGKSTFAELLEQELNSPDGMTAIKLKLSNPMREIAIKMGWNGKKDARGRKLLQDIGVIGREYDPLIWINMIVHQIKALKKTRVKHVIIDDFRFPLEAEEFAKRWPTITIRILRPGQEADLGEQGKHISENALEGYKHNYYLHNTRTLEDLANHAKMIAHILTEGRV